jgi:hypothetical protein
VTRRDGNQRNARGGGSPRHRARTARLLIGFAMVAAAVLLATFPVSRRAAETDQSLSCGAPATAVGRQDRSGALAALRRLEPTETGHRPAATAQDLARLEVLEREVDWYRTCHGPAAQRMVLANGSAALAVALLLVGLLASRRDHRVPASTAYPRRHVHRRPNGPRAIHYTR